MILKKSKSILYLLFFIPFFLHAQSVKVVTNQVGYEEGKAKKAVIVADTKMVINTFRLVDADTHKTVYEGKPIFSGAVSKWKNWLFWTIDFSQYTAPGNYQLQVIASKNIISSYPFIIGRNVLEKATISDVVYYFKGQRSSGLSKRPGTDFHQIDRRILDEAMYGADYLVRMQAKDGSFYRSVGAPGPGKLPQDRSIQGDEGSYRIKQNKNESFATNKSPKSWRSYEASYRSGGGIAIAALAMASAYPVCGEFSNADYLKAAENAFAFLEKDNTKMDFDGKENILDDYCALSAATELYKVTNKEVYQKAAEKRADQLINRLASWKNYKNYWRADNKDRPFFHPADAGLPVVSLLYYYPLASPDMQVRIKDAVKQSMQFELAITHEVNNPFGYSRQLVQDTLGNRKSSFFFPHGSDASPWWQGENARLSSIAAAARMTADLFKDDKPFHDQLDSFALDQLNWILGLNPFDASMLQGTGHNNPAYGFFGTFEYTNAPGGIVNGITSGFDSEDDIDLNIPYSKTGKDSDWRWAEQWLPHTTWYLLAVALRD